MHRVRSARHSMRVLVVGARRPRARARVEARRRARRRRRVLRARQCRHRAASPRAVADRSPAIPRRVLDARRARAHRSHRRRSGAAARSRHRRSASRAARPAASSGRRAPPRSSSAARCSRRPSWRATASRRRAIASATPPRRRARCSRAASSAFPSWSRRTGWRRARAWSSPPIAPTADAAIRAAMDERQFGAAGARAGHRGVPGRPGGLVLRALRRHAARCRSRSAQDHKRIFDDDRGPNTGGMGAFSPSPLIDDALQATVMREIVEPVLRGLRRRRARVPRLPLRRPDADLRRPEGDRVQRAVRRSRGAGGDSARSTVRWLPLPGGRRGRPARRPAASPSAVTGWSASCSPRAGYPGPVRAGVPIAGLDGGRRARGVTVFHSGTARARRRDRHRRRPRADRRRPRRRPSRPRSRAPTRVSRRYQLRRHALPPRHRRESARSQQSPT